MSKTRHPLPQYNRKWINITVLPDTIDRVNLKISKALTLVDSASGHTTRPMLADRHGSIQPTHVTTHEPLQTDLTITATPEGRTVRAKATP